MNEEEKETVKADINEFFINYRWSCQYAVDLTRIGIQLVRNQKGSYYDIIENNQIFMPAHALQIPEDKVEEAFIINTLRNSVRDIIEYFHTYLNNIHYCGVVYRKTFEYRENIDRNPINLQDINKKYEKKPLEQKLKILKEKYDINIPYEDQINSIHIARNCLVHRMGYVTEKETEGGNEFTLKYLRNVFIDTNTNKEIDVWQRKSFTGSELKKWKLKLKIQEFEKSFEVNSPMIFTSQEFYDLGFTFYEIGRLLMIETVKFGSRCGVIEYEKIIDPYDAIIEPKFIVK
jgi:hypothetical protein